MHYFIKNLILVTSKTIINNAYIEIKDGIILNYGKYEKINLNIPVYDGKKLKVFPGFIDCHTHGGYGVDFENCDDKKYFSLCKNFLSEGITSFLFTSVCNNKEFLNKQLSKISQLIDYQKKEKTYISECLGFHLEGPFIDESKKGAHKKEFIFHPNVSLLKEFIDSSNKNIKMITYSIKNDLNATFGKFLKLNNIIGSIGHCNATHNEFKKYDEFVKIKHITHLFNAMSGIENRNLGIAFSGLYNKNTICELIVDNIHVDKDLVKLTIEIKGAKNICLITDSISAKGLQDGIYKLGELEVSKVGNKCVLANTNILAGSVLRYIDAFKNIRKIGSLTDIELLYMSSKNVAIQLGLDKEIGDIDYNMKANLVFLNNNYDIEMTMIDGKISYKASI